MEDAELLRRFAEENSEEAFAELVRRRIDLVYSVALRHLAGDTHLAQDVTQAVFIDLARKARGLAQRPVLTGWLYRSAQFAAGSAVRTERRRRAREEEAELMKQHLPKSAPDWTQLRPVLDEALDALSERDRDAVALRYFESRSFAEIGRVLELTEDAARKRVERALQKMHAVLADRGIASTTAAMASILAAAVANAAPAGLAAAVTGAALAGGGATVGAAATFLTMTKLQMAVATTAFLGGTAAFLVQSPTTGRLRAEIEALQIDEPQLATLRSETARLAAFAAEVADLRRDDVELGQLRDEAEAVKRSQINALRARTEKSRGRIDSATAPTLDVQQLDVLPAARFRTPPLYPLEMRQAGIGGEVLVEFLIDVNGGIRDVRAKKSTRTEFESAAVEAVKQWEFKPGEKDRGPVNVRMQVPMVFRTGEPGSPGNPPTDPLFATETGLSSFWITANLPKPGEKPVVPQTWF